MERASCTTDGTSGDDGDTNNTAAFLAQFLTSLPLGLGIMFFYCIVRRRYSNIIEVRRSKQSIVSHGSISSTSWFMWMWELWQLPDTEYYRHAGIDAFMFDFRYEIFQNFGFIVTTRSGNFP